MFRICSVLLFSILFLSPKLFANADSKSSEDWKVMGLAKTRGTIGEVDTLNLVKDGLHVSIMTNDILGGTDKLMTGSTSKSYLKSYEDSSFILTGYWRALTPVYQKHYSRPKLDLPIGKFADWSELQLGHSQTLWVNENYQLNLQNTLGAGHLGDKGILGLHSTIHSMVGNAHMEDYFEAVDGTSLSFGQEVGLIGKKPLKLLGGIFPKYYFGYYSNLVTKEAYLGTMFQGDLGNYKWSFDGQLVRQLYSEFYHSIRNYRGELGIGVLLPFGFKPAIKYISPYLKDDEVRQIYLDFSFYVEL